MGGEIKGRKFEKHVLPSLEDTYWTEQIKSSEMQMSNTLAIPGKEQNAHILTEKFSDFFNVS